MRNDVRDISATRPDMAVVGQDRLGLSPFGMLSQVFNQEILRRSQPMTGAYWRVPLTLLEEEEDEGDAPPAAKSPELHFDVAVNVKVEAPKEKKEKDGANEGKPLPAEERILERVRVLQRELRQSQETTRRLILQSGSHRQEVRFPTEKPAPAEGVAADSREVAAPGGHPPFDEKEYDRGGAFRPMTHAKELPLVSAATAAPAEGGWTPRQQQLHPGYPVPGEERPDKDATAAGSILLPDALRRRRQQVLDRQSQSQSLYGEFGSVMEWAVQGEAEDSRSDASVWLIRRVEEAVHRTMEKNRVRQTETGQRQPRQGSDSAAAQGESARSDGPSAHRDREGRGAGDVSGAEYPRTGPAPGQPPAAERFDGHGAGRSEVAGHDGIVGTTAEGRTADGFPAPISLEQPTAEVQGQLAGIPLDGQEQAHQEVPLTHRESAPADAETSPTPQGKKTESQTRPTPESATTREGKRPGTIGADSREVQDTQGESPTASRPGAAGQVGDASAETSAASQETESSNAQPSKPSNMGETVRETQGENRPLTAVPAEMLTEQGEVPLTHRESAPADAEMSPTPQGKKAEPQTRSTPESATTREGKRPGTVGADSRGAQSAQSESPTASRPGAAGQVGDASTETSAASQETESSNAQPSKPSNMGATRGETVGEMQGENRPLTAVPAEMLTEQGEVPLTHRESAPADVPQSAASVSAEQPDGAKFEQRVVERTAHTPQQVSRDIRVTTRQRGSRAPADSQTEKTPDSPAATETERPMETAEGALRGPATAIPQEGRTWTGAPELTFAQPPWERQEVADQPETPKNDYLNSLPQWARELLEQPAPHTSGVGSVTWQAPQGSGLGYSYSAGTPAYGASAPQPGAVPGGTIQWTAPGARAAAPDATTQPVPIQYREKAEPEDQFAPQRPPGLSEAEVQKAADKVYRIIEERLRRELRRSGR